MGLTPADVHNVAFSKPPIGKRGYNEDEVDAFLDLIEAELARLIEENNDLRQQVEQLDSQLGNARVELEDARNKTVAGGHSPVRAVDEPRRLTPVPPPSVMEQTSPGGDHHVQAAKVLGLAQEMADRLTGEAKAESDGMLSEARTKSEQLLSEARAKADSMVNEARTRAETMLNDARTRAETLERQAREKAAALERDAQRKHTEVMGSITQEKNALEKKLDTLRTFEREYRTRLKTFLESRLQELIDQGSAAPAAPTESRANQSGYTFGTRAAEAG
ncbi:MULTISPECIES: DivIVA-like cell division protein Wag31 [Crossiella]|uniref:Cell wall synthesis protein Wag31 n=1 Tax=Crossiella cryophila TaxID=43355 RepID=A0A7W7C962_9PSEU|nr:MULTISPECIES: DivIVA domain-containing protein [Crossiella]MBB4676811.1 DivIVA domain-containing protein [Crossiella cryophila]MCK2240270.1 DivIVA domain-containing protein [Crossiella sp. S99.2]MCK2253278.1 DivIVA domain-containing protein [Crossiella sp. S99.1]